MKGSHTVEGFLNWIDNNEQLSIITKIHLKKTLKNAADKASTTGQPGEVKIISHKKHIASIRVFEDGSCALGYDPELMKKPIAFINPPPEKEM